MSSCRSRLVAATNRNLTVIVRSLPTRWISPVCKTLKKRVWQLGVSSPTSSRNSVPEAAEAIFPTRALVALDRIIGVDRIFAFYTGFAGFFAEVLDAGFGQLGHAVFGKLSPKGADHFGAE